MKIAVVTDDHRTISAHFGRAVFYEVFTISDGKITAQETLPKPAHGQPGNQHQSEPGFAHGFGPTEEGLHALMLAPIRDCQVLLAGGMGQGAFNNLSQAGIHPILTDILEIDLALKSYLVGHLGNRPERLH